MRFGRTLLAMSIRQQLRPFTPLPGMAALCSPHPAADQRDEEQDDCNPEENACAFHGGARNAAETESGRDKRDDEKHNGVVKKIAHLISSLSPLDDAGQTRLAEIRSVAPIVWRASPSF
jgi:hypothetical protein